MGVAIESFKNKVIDALSEEYCHFYQQVKSKIFYLKDELNPEELVQFLLDYHEQFDLNKDEFNYLIVRELEN